MAAVDPCLVQALASMQAVSRAQNMEWWKMDGIKNSRLRRVAHALHTQLFSIHVFEFCLSDM